MSTVSPRPQGNGIDRWNVTSIPSRYENLPQSVHGGPITQAGVDPFIGRISVVRPFGGPITSGLTTPVKKWIKAHHHCLAPYQSRFGSAYHLASRDGVIRLSPNSLCVRYARSRLMSTLKMVRVGGFEPPWDFSRQNLNLLWLPLHHTRVFESFLVVCDGGEGRT